MKCFMGTMEQEQFLNLKNQQIKYNRMKEVRKQENENTKKQIAIKKQQMKQLQEEQERQDKYQEYLKKLALIEELNKQKEISIIEIGKAQREAELFKQKQIEEQKRKAEIEQINKEQMQKRYNDAQDWKQQQYLSTEFGKQQFMAQQRKESYIQEKTREQQSLNTYKEYSKSKILNQTKQDMESYEKFDKNVSKRQVLKPEDFANTCFHQVVKHDLNEQENAMEKANQTMIDIQAEFLEKTRIQREVDRAQKERSKKAIQKEKQQKVLEQLEQESRFLKKKEVQEIQKNRPPIKKTQNQKQLNEAFNKIFTDKIDIEVKSHAKSTSPKRKSSLKEKKERPKSVKIFTKAPLDTNLYNDYSNYELQSPHEEIESNKKKVQFAESSQSKQDLSQSQNQQSIQQSSSQYSPSPQKSPEFMQNSQMRSQEQEQSLVESDGEPEPPRTNQINDIKQYIKEQENYLAKLEQQRIQTAQRMKQEESNLVNSLRQTKQLMRSTIPEESEDGSSQYQETPQKEDFNVHQESQQSQQSQCQPMYSPNLMESSSFNSPLLESNSNNKYDTIENMNTQDIMQQFLRPKKQQQDQQQQQQQQHQYEQFKQRQEELQRQLQEQHQRLQEDYQQVEQVSMQDSIPFQTIDSSEKDSNNKNNIQFFISPKSDLNYSISDIKRDKISPIKIEQQDYQDEQEYQYQQQYPKQQQIQDDYEQTEQDREETLGEIFKKRNAELAQKMKNRQNQKTIEKQGKTKEELIQIRKEMMKSKRQASFDKQQSQQSQQQQQQQQQQYQQQQQQLEPEDDHPKAQLMRRLAQGEKVKVDKKEMLELTNKNYEQLPEVRERKQKQERSDSIKQRKQKVKEMDMRLRETMKQKREKQ